MAAGDDDALFPLPPVEETEAVQKEEPGPVAKSFRPYDPNQVLLLPPSLEEWLPERHLARFVSELVEEALNLSAIRAAYTEERGYPPYDPRLMVKGRVQQLLEKRRHSLAVSDILCSQCVRRHGHARHAHLSQLSVLQGGESEPASAGDEQVQDRPAQAQATGLAGEPADHLRPPFHLL